MKLHTSFRGKLLLLAVLPLAIAQLVTLLAVMRTVEGDVEQRARESLGIGATVVDEYLSSRIDQIRASVEVLAADFGLKQAVATGDPDSIRSALENHGERVGADAAVALDRRGRLIASSGSELRFEPPSGGDDDGIEDLPAYQSTAVADGSVYQTFAVPLRAPVHVGWVVMGFRVDTATIDRIASLTGMDVVLVAGREATPLLASTGAAAFDAQPAAGGLELGPLRQVFLHDSGDLDYLAIAAPLSANAASRSDVAIVLLRSLSDAMAPYTEVRRGLVAFAAVLLVLVALAAAWVSGGIARPLQVLSDAARRMISGNYEQAIRVQSRDEVGELATSFNAMQTAIAEREQRISHQALHDPLTALPNRSHITERTAAIIADARQAGTNVHVLLIRLSRMSAISSTLGHDASDQLVTRAARHLEVNLGDGELLGHVGTHELIVVLDGGDTEDALARAEKLHGILESGVTLGRTNITLQSEIGIASFPRHATDAATLLRNAAIASTEARARQSPIAVFQRGREEFYVRQLRIVNDLRAAVHREEVRLHFQPKVSLPDGEPCGAEALVRWEHPELGRLPPDEFVPAAEEAGTIVHLTRYVLKSALAECRRWLDRGHSLPVSVNVSARDLCDDYLPYYVLQLLQEQSIAPHYLTLEVTENTVVEDLHRASTVLECLRDLGIRTSMDDFGTGQSSLAQLRNIPLDELKIDKSFVIDLAENAENQAIVRTTLELAHSLGLSVVAEGVEHEGTLDYLAAARCEQVQGHFLCRPVRAAELLVWLERRRHAALRMVGGR